MPQRDAADRIVAYQLQWVPAIVVAFAEANPDAAGALRVEGSIEGRRGA